MKRVLLATLFGASLGVGILYGVDAPKKQNSTSATVASKKPASKSPVAKNFASKPKEVARR